MEVTRYSRQGRECILIGHAGHPEVEGTMGQYDTANGGASTWSRAPSRSTALEVRNPTRAVVRDADHAVGRRHGAP
jgi:4-hydroxy-3-methylbut-2-enyl diphosphate reductase